MANINLLIPDGDYCADTQIRSCMFEKDNYCRLYDEPLLISIKYKLNNNVRTSHEKCKLCKTFMQNNNKSRAIEALEEN